MEWIGLLKDLPVGRSREWIANGKLKHFHIPNFPPHNPCPAHDKNHRYAQAPFCRGSSTIFVLAKTKIMKYGAHGAEVV